MNIPTRDKGGMLYSYMFHFSVLSPAWFSRYIMIYPERAANMTHILDVKKCENQAAVLRSDPIFVPSFDPIFVPSLDFLQPQAAVQSSQDWSYCCEGLHVVMLWSHFSFGICLEFEMVDIDVDICWYMLKWLAISVFVPCFSWRNALVAAVC